MCVNKGVIGDLMTRREDSGETIRAYLILTCFSTFPSPMNLSGIVQSDHASGR